MDKCKEAFEKQKHLTIYISNLVFDEKDNRYIPNEKRIRTFEEWEWKAFSNQAYAVNLAWWAWQSRQAEVDQLQEELAKLKDRLELAHHLATQSTWSSLKQLKKVVKALRGEHE